MTESVAAELSRRARQLLFRDGLRNALGRSVRVGDIYIKLERFTLSVADTSRSENQVIYAELDCVWTNEADLPQLQKALDALRQHMILDDLADV